jgi:transcriptional regulator with XRE-family HTH domain
MVKQQPLLKEKKRIGAEIKKRRLEREFDRKDLASAVGVTVGMIGHIERGLYWPSMPVYILICRVLGMEEPK